MKDVIVVDYGIGNLLSVARALEAVGANPILTSNPNDISNADRVILPGVGAFGHCMDEIVNRNLKEPILEFVSKQRPLLGICVGMQVLHSIGREFGEHQGLGLIDGVVDRIPDSKDPDSIHKIPYVGWAKLSINQDATSNKLSSSMHDKWFYFVHGFMAQPKDERNVLAHYKYNDVRVVACTAKDNIIGTQFHPEKSAESGLMLLKEFLSI